MHLDPHTLHALVEKVRSQLRCPQCMKKVAVELQSLKVIGDSFAVFQLHCRTCEAHILLYATLRMVPASSHVAKQGSIAPTEQLIMHPSPENAQGEGMQSVQKNFSTTLELEAQELHALRHALRETGGNFSEVFEQSV